MPKFFQRSLSTGWSFKESDDDTDEAWMPVPIIPSVVHQDLQANQKLKDPFVGFNELGARWVDGKSWIYRNTIEKPDISSGSSVMLAFDGLDTLARVKLDGEVILKSNNMFLAHRVDVTNALRSGNEHVLEVEFDSAFLRAREIQKHHSEHNWASFNGDSARLGVRKAQYHWGWDWGPMLMTAGIWRDVRIEVYSARFADLWVDTELDSDHQAAVVTVYAEVEAVASGPYRAELALRLGEKEVARETVTVTDTIAKSVFHLKQPSLWWPNGYGDQTLYEVSASLKETHDEVHQVSKRFGIRTAEIIQQPDKHGKSFFFRINGVDIFCGGSCWIPADSLLPSITRERYRKWVELAAGGHQVMLRVWGGGIYEDDQFYNACDELGVMVWQDFMFACGNYPTWPYLLDSIQNEAVYNVRRLRHHPSIVMFVGNNEDYQVQESAGLTYDYQDKNPDNWLKTDFSARYLYEKLLPDVVKEYAPNTFYHPGSPWGDGKRTSDPTVGDLHQWNVWHGTQEKYQVFDTLGGRFNSEFGMEAFPHLPTVHYFVEKNVDNFSQSQVVDFHNKADGHERRIATYLVENLRMATDLETYIYLTQVIQAEAMMYGYRGWRRQWGDGRHCGGALLWQLNDCWPAISWAIVDYFLRPKPAYYAVARVLKPIAVGVCREHHDWSVVHAQPPKTSKYELWITSSLREEAVGKVELRFISIDTGREVREPVVHEDILIVPNGTTDIITDGLIDHVTYPEPHVLAARVWIDDQIVSRDVDWPQPLKYLDFSHRGLDVKRRIQQPFSSGTDNQTMVIETKKPVKCLVFEERDGAELSDNAVDIVPGDEQIVTVTGLKQKEDPLSWKFVGQQG